MADQRVEVVDYDPGWPELFAAQRPSVAELLGPWLASPRGRSGRVGNVLPSRARPG